MTLDVIDWPEEEAEARADAEEGAEARADANAPLRLGAPAADAQFVLARVCGHLCAHMQTPLTTPEDRDAHQCGARKPPEAHRQRKAARGTPWACLSLIS